VPKSKMTDVDRAHAVFKKRFEFQRRLRVRPNVRAKLTAEVCVACARKDNNNPGLERASNACRSGSA
jgi:hypothetical protein